MQLGDRLKALRIDRNLTQKETGRRLGVAESTISLYESGGRVPDPDMLKQYSKCFNVSVDYLLGLVSFPSQIVVPDTLKNYDVKWINAIDDALYAGLSPEDIQKIIKIFDKSDKRKK